MSQRSPRSTQLDSPVQYLRRFGCNRMTVVELVSWEMRTDSAEVKEGRESSDEG